MSIYLKRIILLVLGMGLIVGGVISYRIYTAIFSPNTRFESGKIWVFIPTDATFEDVLKEVSPLLKDVESFIAVAQRKQYPSYVRPGRFPVEHGMNNNEIVNSLRSRNTPIQLVFNNQSSLPRLAARVSSQIEADSLSLLQAFLESGFLERHGLNEDTAISLYIPNQYELFWNTDAREFRDRMYEEYLRFWNEERTRRATAIELTPKEVIALASIVHSETVQKDERPRVAGVYLNRLRKGIPLQADPTVIYAVKKESGDLDQVIKRVLYKDLEIESPYNTYLHTGLPPGPITMPDISAIDAVLNAEKHDYYYFVVDLERPGYHKFAKTLKQHNRNRLKYQKWLDGQGIYR